MFPDKKRKNGYIVWYVLNMAYLQFGGVQGAPGSTTALNRLIRRKLKEYLSANALKQLGVFYSLE